MRHRTGRLLASLAQVHHCLPVHGVPIGTFVAHRIIAIDFESDVVLRPNGSGVFRFLETAACKA